MRVLAPIAKVLSGLLNYIVSLFSRVLCFVKKRKHSNSFNQEQCIPTSIMVDNGKNSVEVNLTDWNTWEDEEKHDDMNNEQEIDLFRDMQPVINKAKVVVVKKKVKPPPMINELNTYQIADSSNFKPQYQVNSELGLWEDESSAWGDDLDDSEISQETDIMLKRTKQLEREKRSQEQRRKKLEKEQMRNEKKPEGHIGVKLS
ncbi:receptor-binding cancer antigen expressed on SiSo cells isoform X2 [Hydra vulgaris]|uniref:Receptor-binding cancer antigen expressed on SiSo cells isoform X2 n=1 Tax=Hydra vulgaris TaxID=6087 RepID=A0ABM4D340_HYDVU